MKPTKTKLAKNVQQLIKVRDLKNKTELANKVAKNHKTVYDIYAGIGNPKLDTLDALAKTLRVPVWYLVQNLFSVKNTDIAKIEKLLTLISDMDGESLDYLLSYAKHVSRDLKIKEALSRYDPSNPLLKK